MPDKTTDVTQTTEVQPTDSPVTPPTPKKPRKPRTPKSTVTNPVPVSDTTPNSKPNSHTTLTASQWLEDVKDINEYSQYLIDKKKDIYVNYNEVFSEVKIEELLTELYNHIVYDIEKELGFFKNDLISNSYLNFLIIKYFTDMKDLLSDSLENNIIVINKLREDSKFKVFFSDIFDNEQVMKVYERMNELSEMLAKLENMEQVQLEELLGNIQTPFLKEKLETKKKIYPVQSSLLSESN